MNSENDSPKNIDSVEPLEVDETSTIDDFIKELEEKEKDLRLSYEDTVIEIDEFTVQNDDLAELEKLLESYESNPSLHSTAAPNSAEPALSSESLSILENKVANLRSDLSKTEKERDEMVESFKRRQSDFENFRKRIERERSETHRNILSGLATQMLPVIDNLNRALDSAGREPNKSSDFQQFIEGIVLVNHQLNDVLAEIGVHPILAVGEPFDPHFHEAVAAEPTAEYPPNTVVAELLRGYKIEGKVIRPAMVKVSLAIKPESSNLLELD